MKKNLLTIVISAVLALIFVLLLFLSVQYFHC